MKNENNYSQYSPIGDRVLLIMPKEDVNGLENVGGILMKRSEALGNNPLRETVVVAAGPDCKQCAPGDVVLWNTLNGQPIPRGDDDLYFIPEPHLVCITKKAPREAFPIPVS